MSAPAIARPGLTLERAGLPERLTEADLTEAEQIAALLRDAPMDGLIQVALTRDPDPALAARIEGGRHATFLARSKGALVGMGTRSVRRVFHAGAEANLGYLGQLRTKARACGIKRLRRGFDELRAARRADELPFDLTAIVSDNAPARRLLERGLPGLPAYTELGEIETLVVPTTDPIWRRSRPAMSASPVPALVDFVTPLRRHHAAHALAPAWCEQDFRTDATQALIRDDLRVVRRDGEVVAGGALWDQRAFKQVRVMGYRPWLAATRAVVNVGLRAAGQPALPPAGQALPLAYASHLFFADDDLDAATGVIDALRTIARARGLGLLSFALRVEHPLRPVLRRRYAARPYRSTMYAVGWDAPAKAEDVLAGRPLYVEVATL